MREWLERMRQKPYGYRQRISFLGAVALTSVIALFWSLSLPERFAALGEVIEESPVEETGRMSNFMTGTKQQFAQVTEAVSGLLRTTTEVEEETTVSSTTASTTTASTSTEREPQVVIPQLRPENTKANQPRIVQIATSSASTSPE